MIDRKLPEISYDDVKDISDEQIDLISTDAAKYAKCEKCSIREISNCGTAPKRNANTVDEGCCYWQWKTYLIDLRKWGEPVNDEEC